MHSLSLDELDALSSEVERAVDATPGIDRWCSGPDWVIPVTTGFAPRAARLLLSTDDRRGFALFTKYYGEAGRPMFGGLEPLWGFGAPVVGPDPAEVARQMVAVLAEREDWHMLFLSGMPTVEQDSTGRRDGITIPIAMALSTLGQVRLAEGITRQVADLSCGYEGWLDRRTARFRRNLRQAASRAESAGLVTEEASDDPALFERLMAIEHRSWKGREGSGISSAEMSTMYRLMVERLRDRGRLAAHVARLDGVDVGYILGGVRARRYRGLQISYADDVRNLSVGNLLQDRQLRQLTAQGSADSYDLGMDIEYKRRWADRAETSLTLIVDRR